MTTQLSVTNLKPVIHNNLSVITTNLLAQLYETEDVRIRQNFDRNQDRFVEGKHYFKITGTELKNLRVSQRYLQISSKTRSLILWTERGAARHAKMLDTDQAWEVFEKLEDSYFSSLSVQDTSTPKTTVDQRTPLRDAVNLLVSKKAITYSEAYSVVHQRFNVPSIEDLPLEQLSQAIEYVHKVALEGEFIERETKTIAMGRIEVSKMNLIALVNHIEWIYKYYKEYNLQEVSRMLKSDFGARLHDHIIDGYLNAKSIM